MMRKRIEHEIIENVEHKLCYKCKQWKILREFYNYKNSWDKLSQVCKNCDKIRNLERYEKNKDDVSERNKLYYQNNKQRIDKRNNDYKLKHLDVISKYKSDWQKQNKKKRNDRLRYRYKNEPVYRLTVLLRTRVIKALNNNQKTGKTLDLLGCSVDKFKEHLENQFRDGMTWENHGKVWHIDHIKPCSKFDLTDETQLKECFHYSNMMPLFVKDNLVKGNRM